LGNDHLREPGVGADSPGYLLGHRATWFAGDAVRGIGACMSDPAATLVRHRGIRLFVIDSADRSQRGRAL
jgi:hypothetical protein